MERLKVLQVCRSAIANYNSNSTTTIIFKRMHILVHVVKLFLLNAQISLSLLVACPLLEPLVVLYKGIVRRLREAVVFLAVTSNVLLP